MLLLNKQISNANKKLERFYTQITLQLYLNCSLADKQSCYIISVVNARRTKSYNHVQRKDLGLQIRIVDKYMFIIYVFESVIFFQSMFQYFC